MKYNSISTMVMAPILLSFFVLLGLSAFSLYKTYWVLEQFETLEQTVVKAERTATDSLNDFKTQVQEWKNVLLRGHTPDDREKYWQRFIDKETQVQKSLSTMLNDSAIDGDAKQLVQQFLTSHKNMAVSYRAGYQAFIDAGFDHKVGDAAVRGIDREPAKLLAELTSEMAAKSSDSLEQLKNSTRRTLYIVLSALIIIFISTLTYVTKRLRHQIIKPVKTIADRIAGLASSDYQQNLTYRSDNELGTLAESTRILQAKLTRSVTTLTEVEGHVKAANDTLIEVSQDIQSGSVEQVEATQHLGRSTALLNDSVEQLAEISSHVNLASNASSSNVDVCYQTFKTANQGFVKLADTVTQSSVIVEALQSRSTNILGVVNVINEIADQTNLLALNAAIEAARAGEHGRGFAVVADEVRALAAKTQQSTKEINQILSSFEAEAESAVSAMQKGKSLSETNAAEADAALTRLADVVSDISKMQQAVEQLNSVTVKQSDVVLQVTGINQRIATVSEQYQVLSKRTDITEHMQEASMQVHSVVNSLKQV